MSNYVIERDIRVLEMRRWTKSGPYRRNHAAYSIISGS